MNLEDILTLPDWKERLELLMNEDYNDRDYESNWKYYDNEHPIKTDPDRADATRTVKSKEADGSIKEESKTIKKSRIVLPYQIQIIETMVGFLFGQNMKLTMSNEITPQTEEAFKIFRDAWVNEVRMDNFNRLLCERVGIQTNAAEIFFVKEGEIENDLSVQLWDNKNGDQLYPNFNDDGKMDAFVRVFTKTIIEDGKPKEVEIHQIYTAEKLYILQDMDEIEAPANVYGKIPVIYYDQKKPEWVNVKDLISKMENIHSQFSDVNKRIGNPSILLRGDVKTMPAYNEDVKVFTASATMGADGKPVFGSVEILESQTAPESVKLEMDKLDKYIYKFSWPDLSFLRDNIKTGQLSGTAIKLMMLDAFVKVGAKRIIWDNGISRRIEVMKTILAAKSGKATILELDIHFEYQSLLPENETEIIENIVQSVTAGVMSKKEGVKKHPYINDPDTVIAELAQELAEELGAGTAM